MKFYSIFLLPPSYLFVSFVSLLNFNPNFPERTDKLRGAKAEAARIVEEYKRQKNAEYDQAVRKFNEDLGDQSRLTGDKTNEEIQKMK